MLKLIAQNNQNKNSLNYTLFDNDLEVGHIQIRLTPSHADEVPPEFASNIYYEINPNQRKKGYGTKILSLGLAKAKLLDLNEVVITCRENNIASKKIIENNGGKLEDSCLIENERFLKYKINLNRF